MTKSRSEELSQVDRFREAARSLGCDEDEGMFDEKLKGIARPSVPKCSDPGADRSKRSNSGRKPRAK